MVGKRLLQVIKAKKLSQNKLALSIGVSSGNISDIIKGKNSPSAKFLTLLSEQYNVNLNWLLTGKGSMFNGNDPPEDSNRISELEKECEKLRAEVAALEAENKEINKELRERFKQLMGLHEAALKGQC
jgi:transcriptional regulator with XRE-family HTH domain